MPTAPGSFQHLRELATPKDGDLIIRERQSILTATVPVYGSAYPAATKLPAFADYIFVHARIVDDSGLWLETIYAKDRASQHDYNYNLEYPYGGNPAYPRIKRTYILRRGTAETDNALDLGSADPGGAAGSFGSVLTSTGGSLITSTGGIVLRPAVGTGVLVAQFEKQLPEPLGSVYVEVERWYDIIPGAETPTNSDGLTQTDTGYTVTRPMEDSAFLQLEWRISLPREIADTYRSSNYRQCPISGYESLILVNEVIEASRDNNQVSVIVRTYQGNSSGDAFPSTAYLKYQGKFRPGALPPERFIVSMRKVTDDYRTDASANQSVTVPEDAPNSPNNLYQGGLISVQAEPLNGSTLRGHKTTEYYTDLVLTVIAGRQYDNNIGNYINYSIQALPAAEAAAITATPGQEVTIEPVNALWSVVTTERPTVGLEGIAFNANAKVSIGTHPAYWPQVLTVLRAAALGIRPEPGADVEDASAILFDWTMKPAWSGDAKATTTIAYSISNPLITMAGVPTQNLDTTGLDLVWPGVANLHIPACLHQAYSFVGTTGTNHPQYGLFNYTKDWPATTYTDWPDTLIIKFDVRPYKGGYAVRKVEVKKPY